MLECINLGINLQKTNLIPLKVRFDIARIKGVTDSQIYHNNTKKCLLFEINTIIKFLLFRMKYITDGGYLCDDLLIQLHYHLNV